MLGIIWTVVLGSRFKFHLDIVPLIQFGNRNEMVPEIMPGLDHPSFGGDS